MSKASHEQIPITPQPESSPPQISEEPLLLDFSDPIQLELHCELVDNKEELSIRARLGASALTEIVGDTYDASGVAAKWALKVAQTAPRSALAILRTTAKWPDTQVGSKEFSTNAINAAAAGDIESALEGANMSISLTENTEEDKHLDLETIVLNRAHRALYALQTLGIVYSAFLGHKAKNKITEISEGEQKLKDALDLATKSFTSQIDLGPIQKVYDLPGKGLGEILALGNHVIEVMGTLGDENRTELIKKSLTNRLPGGRKSNKENQ